MVRNPRPTFTETWITGKSAKNGWPIMALMFFPVALASYVGYFKFSGNDLVLNKADPRQFFDRPNIQANLGRPSDTKDSKWARKMQYIMTGRTDI
jgi:hypothetical protein